MRMLCIVSWVETQICSGGTCCVGHPSLAGRAPEGMLACLAAWNFSLLVSIENIASVMQCLKLSMQVLNRLPE
jgi:hypothetical protein